MNSLLLDALAGLLVSAYVLAGANLIRLLVAQGRDTNRSRQRRRLRQGASGSPAYPSTRGGQVAVASLLILAPQAALAQGGDVPTSQPAPTSPPSPPPVAPQLAISTDRPSFSDGTGIQPLWRLNLETGYTYIHRDRDGIESERHNGPEMLARVGLVEDRLELRVIWSGYVEAETESGGARSTANGLADLAIGFKLKLFDQGEFADWAPRLALGVQTTIGTGGTEVSTQEEEPVLKLLWSCDLGTCWGEKWTGWAAGGNLNLAWPTSGEDTDHFEQFQASIYINAPLFDRCTGFAEYFVLTPNTDGGDAAHYADFGAVYLLSPGVQLDARMGFGLNNEADNFFAGVGISLLF